MFIRFHVLVTAFAAVVLISPSRTVPAAGPTKEKRPDIYDRTADGEKQIATALEEARCDHKRVLLQLGANWCSWCHKLHALFQNDKEIARTLLYEYVVVHIDVDKSDGDKRHNESVNERLGNPVQHGLPVLVVLDADGKQLVTQNTGDLEEGDHHNREKVLAFLKKWQGEAPPAQKVLDAGLARAKAESKRVFVYFSAPWCGWCHRLDEYLHRPEIDKVFSTAFVAVKIDVERMAGGKEMDQKYRGSENGGIPFFAILDADGKKLADANGSKGNVGFPVEPHEVAHFMKVVKETAPKIDARGLSTLEQGLAKGKE